MKWVKRMQSWLYSLSRKPDGGAHDVMTARDTEEQRLLEEVWQRIDAVRNDFVGNRKRREKHHDVG